MTRNVESLKGKMEKETAKLFCPGWLPTASVELVELSMPCALSWWHGSTDGQCLYSSHICFWTGAIRGPRLNLIGWKCRTPWALGKSGFFALSTQGTQWLLRLAHWESFNSREQGHCFLPCTFHMMWEKYSPACLLKTHLLPLTSKMHLPVHIKN